MARNKTKSDTRTVQLQSGGQVTVTLEGNVFDLGGADRDFVSSLIEMVQAYEVPEPPPPRTRVGSDDIDLVETGDVL